MTCEEFSIGFDLLYNNISSNQSPGLNDYEKSVFLTDAQKQIVSELYRGNSIGQFSFESAEEVADYLNVLVRIYLKTPITGESQIIPFFGVPDDFMFSIYENCEINSYSDSCSFKNPKAVTVIPIKHDELGRIMENPFRGPNKTRVLRFYTGSDIPETSQTKDSDLYKQTIHLVSKYPIVKYTMKYLRKPEPIVLQNFTSSGLKIDGVSTKQTCRLPEPLHNLILKRAVELAKAVWAA